MNEGTDPPLRLVTWNTTRRCNLRCSHCYLSAEDLGNAGELSTSEGFALLDNIADMGRPIVVLSGGEPLLRNDIFELARHGTSKGLRMTLGTNGTLIDEEVARKLRDAGIKRVAISLDSSIPEVHDSWRGMKGAWQRSIGGIEACMDQGVGVQANITISRRNLGEVDNMLDMVRERGVRDVHLFFLVPTGRGRTEDAVQPAEYEEMIKKILDRADDALSIQPTCAPQFMRIAQQMGLRTPDRRRGCIAGISYCRVRYDGAVTPCPYLNLVVGDVRSSRLRDIWTGSDILRALRDPSMLRGKCGRCGYREVCGGCRARAFGTAETEDKEHQSLFDEDPWCLYAPPAEEL